MRNSAPRTQMSLGLISGAYGLCLLIITIVVDPEQVWAIATVDIPRMVADLSDHED